MIVVAVAHLLVAGAALAKSVALDDAGILEQFYGAIHRRDRDLVVDRDAAAIEFLDVGMISCLRQHDHLINLRDGKVIEFTSEEIEKLQAEIARKLGYKLVDHRLELYCVPLDDDKS